MLGSLVLSHPRVSEGNQQGPLGLLNWSQQTPRNVSLSALRLTFRFPVLQLYLKTLLEVTGKLLFHSILFHS